MANLTPASRRGTNREVDYNASAILHGSRTARATAEITMAFEMRSESSSLSNFDSVFSGFRQHLFLSCGATTALLAAATEVMTRPGSAEVADVMESSSNRNGGESASTAVLENTMEQQAATETLFQPVQLGRYKLPHRMLMAPLTRSRARQPGNVPSPMNALYYAQRSTAALIVSEATQVSQQGQGYAWTPGIHSLDQVEGWRLVTEAVHKAGGLIFMQLWHVGRISHPSLQPDGMLPVAPSSLKPKGLAFIENESGEGELVPFVTPRALETEEIPYIIKQYVRGARNALEAGVDGIEIHAANGYLLDQFLNSGTNRRTDAYGGSVENRARLLLEVVEAVTRVWGANRVGVRLSPLGTFNDICDQDPEKTFGCVAKKLNEYGLAYLHLVNPAIAELEKGIEPDPRAIRMLDLMRKKFRGTLIITGGFDQGTAENWLKQGRADLIGFGRKFLANPDLPNRFRQHAHLNADDPATYYGGGAIGYIDYLTLAQERGEEPKPHVDERWR
nr:alkene reductase [Acidisarcina polymorpha]